MKKLSLASSAIVALLFMLTAFAQPPEVDRKGPCREDAQKFCKDVKAGGGRVWKCLKSHETELSQACIDQMAAGKERMRDFGTTCREDRKKFCKDIRPGKGRIVACLKNHEQELSESCKNFLQKN